MSEEMAKLMREQEDALIDEKREKMIVALQKMWGIMTAANASRRSAADAALAKRTPAR